jgi:predicted nucleic acid-binding protein
LTSFVLDNSVAMRWCFENAISPYAENVLQQLTVDGAFVPILWRYEVSAVLAKAQRDNLISAAKVSAFLNELESFNITIDDEGKERIWGDVHRLAITHRLTSYDAAYLELSLRRNIPLVTLDKELIQVCKRIGHPVL